MEVVVTPLAEPTEANATLGEPLMMSDLWQSPRRPPLTFRAMEAAIPPLTSVNENKKFTHLKIFRQMCYNYVDTYIIHSIRQNFYSTTFFESNIYWRLDSWGHWPCPRNTWGFFPEHGGHWAVELVHRAAALDLLYRIRLDLHLELLSMFAASGGLNLDEKKIFHHSWKLSLDLELFSSLECLVFGLHFCW